MSRRSVERDRHADRSGGRVVAASNPTVDNAPRQSVAMSQDRKASTTEGPPDQQKMLMIYGNDLRMHLIDDNDPRFHMITGNDPRTSAPQSQQGVQRMSMSIGLTNDPRMGMNPAGGMPQTNMGYDPRLSMGADPRMSMAYDPRMGMQAAPGMTVGYDPRMTMIADPRMNAGYDPRMAMPMQADPRMNAGYDPRLAAGYDPRMGMESPMSASLPFR